MFLIETNERRSDERDSGSSLQPGKLTFPKEREGSTLQGLKGGARRQMTPSALIPAAPRRQEEEDRQPITS